MRSGELRVQNVGISYSQVYDSYWSTVELAELFVLINVVIFDTYDYSIIY